jgi:hypothetical protein
MNPEVGHAHASYEALEEYIFQRLKGPQLDEFEEHLLVCHSCQDRLAKTEQYISIMKAALEQVREEPEVASAVPFWRRLFDVPTPVWVGALACALVLAIVPMRRPDSQHVDLTSYRGAEAPVAGKAGAPLELSLDATGLTDPKYRVDLADNRGAVVWSGEGSVTAGRIEAKVPNRLSAGRYWVRLYPTSGSADSLREFGLKLE